MAKFDKKVRSWSLKPETGFYLCPFRQSWSNTKQRKIKLDRKIILLLISIEILIFLYIYYIYMHYMYFNYIF